jgi:hypothetical protein
MTLYLEGETPLSAIIFPSRGNGMSRDIKDIGMDVHKEAIVIAVPSGSGKLVMESIVETKASSLLQFIHRLRHGMHFVDRGAEFYDAQHRKLQINYLKRKAANLGFQIIAAPAAQFLESLERDCAQALFHARSNGLWQTGVHH